MTILIVIFLLGYVAIAFEHSLKINKAAAALITGVLCWTVYIVSGNNPEHVTDELLHHLGEIASILFFLLGAMTIVELIDSHDGFTLITNRITARRKTKLLWILSVLTFFLSALLDNLTTAIVMTSLSRKLLEDKEDRLWFIGMIVIAANAGGAFSPLGDVTTTMLWIGGQITAANIIKELLFPSIAVCLVPLIILSLKFRGQTFTALLEEKPVGSRRESTIILILGVTLLLLVPVFKMVTHLPPFMGISLGLGILWIAVSVLHLNKPEEEKSNLMVTHALQKIDSPSILFFLGILLAVSAMQSFGILTQFALVLDNAFGNIYIIGTVLGLVSSVIDNVPLVAAAQGMYHYPTDHHFWEFLALTTGTGGSAIIIGSAAGVAAMGIENIEFLWYLKKISLLAIAGFLAGIGIFLLQTLIC